MKTLIIKNTSTEDILDYPIEEADLGRDGDVQMKQDGSGTYIGTGRTLTWTIKAKENVEVPSYVGRYLCEIYGFLDVLRESNLDVKSEKPVVSESGNPVCRHCGKEQKSIKGLALHIASKHSDKL